MTDLMELITKERMQYLVYIGLSAGTVILTGILYFSNQLLFRKFIGSINPILAFLMVAILGIVLFTVLLHRGWLVVYQQENLSGLFRYSGLAALFLIVSVLIDLQFGFPADMNIAFPQAVLFYPAIGFLVEIVFHVFPLTMLLIIMTTIFRNAGYPGILWICILLVALIEPSFQAMPMISSNQFPFWAVAIVWLNLYLFNMAQLLIFQRFDFASMFSFRLVYYLLWHIVWGAIRLNIHA